MFLLNRDNKEEVKAEIADLQYKMFLLNYERQRIPKQKLRFTIQNVSIK